MDPNKALEIIRESLQILQQEHVERLGFTYFDVVRFMDHVEALDEWLSKGGYLPADWQGRS